MKIHFLEWGSNFVLCWVRVEALARSPKTLRSRKVGDLLCSNSNGNLWLSIGEGSLFIKWTVWLAAYDQNDLGKWDW